MTSYYFIVSIKLCAEFGNDGYIIMCNFGARSMSGFEIIGSGGRSLRGPVGRRKQHKSRVRIGLMNAVTFGTEPRLL